MTPSVALEEMDLITHNFKHPNTRIGHADSVTDMNVASGIGEH